MTIGSASGTSSLQLTDALDQILPLVQPLVAEMEQLVTQLVLVVEEVPELVPAEPRLLERDLWSKEIMVILQQVDGQMYAVPSSTCYAGGGGGAGGAGGPTNGGNGVNINHCMVNLEHIPLPVVVAVAVGVLAVHTHMVMDGPGCLVDRDLPGNGPNLSVDQVVAEMEEVLLQPLTQAAVAVVAVIMDQVVRIPVEQVEQEFVLRLINGNYAILDENNSGQFNCL